MKPIQSRPSLQSRLCARIRADIHAGRLSPHQPLPSVRAFARTEGISAYTAQAVYAQLTALGLLRAQAGVGYFVEPPTASASPMVAMDALWEHRQEATAHSIVVDAGNGWLPSDWQFQSGLSAALRTLALNLDSIEGYGTALGFEPLRLFLSERARRSGLGIQADQILLTQGASQGLDWLVRTLLEPSDEVAIDEPAYPPTLELLRARGVKIHAIPRHSHGPDVQSLKSAARTGSLKAFMTNTSFQNPTGSTTQRAVALEIIALAHQHGFWVIEDEIFNELNPTPIETLAQLDQCQRVIQVGSFSKTLSSSLRAGFAVGPKALIHELAHLKTQSTLGSSEITERLVLSMLTSAHYRKHLSQLQHKLAQAQQNVQTHLHEQGIEWHSKPSGGLFLFGKFKRHQATAQRWRRAIEAGVLLAPGELFRVDGRASPYWRFNVARASDSRLWEVLKRI